MSNSAFKKVALISRPGKHSVPPTLIALARYLQAIEIDVVVESQTAEMMANQALTIVDRQAIAEHAELIIVVGGDGSFINAAHIAAAQNLPILGINRGRLGFLTDIYPYELEAISNVLSGQYQVEQRFMLEAHIGAAEKALALNEVVLLPGDAAHMIEFDIHINDNYVCHQRADGLIIATPTGSTAYALSGGGPILHPGLNAVVLLPMFPHVLSSRPIVVDCDSQIRIEISKTTKTVPFVSCDGHQRIALLAGEELCIGLHQKKITLIHPHNYNYYATLQTKLGWQTRASIRETIDQ